MAVCNQTLSILIKKRVRVNTSKRMLTSELHISDFPLIGSTAQHMFRPFERPGEHTINREERPH